MARAVTADGALVDVALGAGVIVAAVEAGDAGATSEVSVAGVAGVGEGLGVGGGGWEGDGGEVCEEGAAGGFVACEGGGDEGCACGGEGVGGWRFRARWDGVCAEHGG